MIIKRKTITIETVNKKGKVKPKTIEVTLDKSHLGQYSVVADGETMYTGFNTMFSWQRFNEI